MTGGAPALRWWILGSFVGMIAATTIAMVIAGVSENSTVDAGALAMLVAVPLFFTYLIATLVWIYKSWEMLPDSMRYTASGTHVSPGQAVGCLFIPFYNLYWYFVCSVGLCSALNMALTGLGSPKRASTGLATAAAIFQVIPYVNILVAPFMWLIFMFNVEEAKREYARLSGRV
jgi:hypothetical protein